MQLLGVCAYLAPEPIALDLFTTRPGLLPQPLSAAAADPIAFADALAVLADYSLAKRTPAGLQVHRLIQTTTRMRHPLLGPATQAAVTPDPVAGPAPGHADHPLAVTLVLLRASAPGETSGVPAAWPRWAVLLPHVLAATSHTTTQLGPEVLQSASWLLGAGGSYLRVRGRPGDAKSLLEQALAMDEAAYGPDHFQVATDLNNVALVLRDLGKPGQAQPLLERALAITEAAYGPDHPTVAIRLNNLVTVLRELGKPGQAQPLQERALAITEATRSAQTAPPSE